MQLLPERAARIAAVAGGRAKSLEDVVFAFIPQSGGQDFSDARFVRRDKALPVVLYLEFSQGVQGMAVVLPKAGRVAELYLLLSWAMQDAWRP